MNFNIKTLVRDTRNAFSRWIAAPTTITPESEQDTIAEGKHRTATTRKQYVEVGHYDHRGQPVQSRMKGFVTTEDLADLNVIYSRSAVASTAMWWASMRLHNAIAAKNSAAQVKQTACFADWCDAAAINKDERFWDKLELSVGRLNLGKPPKQGSEETDAIRARMTRKSVDDFRKEREQKYQDKLAENNEVCISTFEALKAAVGSGMVQHIPAQQAIDAVVRSAEWVAGWDGDDAEIAGILLDMEKDIKHLKTLAVQRTDEAFVEGMMCADTIGKRYDNVDRDAELRTDSDQDEADERPARRRIRQVAREELALDPLEILIAREEQAA